MADTLYITESVGVLYYILRWFTCHLQTNRAQQLYSSWEQGFTL